MAEDNQKVSLETSQEMTANEHTDDTKLTNENVANSEPTNHESDADWNIMTAEELELEKSLDEEAEEKRRIIERVMEEHEAWRVEYNKKKERVTSRWKSLQEKREHRKFIEQMMT